MPGNPDDEAVDSALGHADLLPLLDEKDEQNGEHDCKAEVQQQRERHNRLPVVVDGAEDGVIGEAELLCHVLRRVDCVAGRDEHRT